MTLQKQTKSKYLIKFNENSHLFDVGPALNTHKQTHTHTHTHLLTIAERGIASLCNNVQNQLTDFANARLYWLALYFVTFSGSNGEKQSVAFASNFSN